MLTEATAPTTPITAKADRADPRIRLLEEAILLLRGRWPTAATGICLSVNRLFGFSLGGGAARGQQLDESIDEALRLVEALYGRAAVAEVLRLANRGGRHEREPRQVGEHPGLAPAA